MCVLSALVSIRGRWCVSQMQLTVQTTLAQAFAPPRTPSPAINARISTSARLEATITRKETPRSCSRFDLMWNSRLEELKEYKSTHGDCNVPLGQGRLGEWVHTQRRFYSKGKLPQERIHALEEVGFVWDLKDKLWSARFVEIQKYKNQHGDCNVPVGQGQLRRWVSKQRYFYKRGELPQERIERLESIGFTWNYFEEDWKSRFNDLIVYSNEHGDCNVPQSHGSLGFWVQTQRSIYKKGKLLQERIDLLEGIGFVWNPTDEAWLQRFEELERYQQDNGDCNVSQRHDALGKWVKEQRQRYKKGKLIQERVDLLESIGFQWALSTQSSKKKSWKLDEQWKTRYTELVRYLIEHGHCHVPNRQGSLGYWVSTQRGNYAEGTMPQYRIEYLESIGFAWKLKRAGRKWFPVTDLKPDKQIISRIIEEERPLEAELPVDARESLRVRVEVGKALAEALDLYIDNLG